MQIFGHIIIIIIFLLFFYLREMSQWHLTTTYAHNTAILAGEDIIWKRYMQQHENNVLPEAFAIVFFSNQNLTVLKGIYQSVVLNGSC